MVGPDRNLNTLEYLQAQGLSFDNVRVQHTPELHSDILVARTAIKGLLVVLTRRFPDHRGWFAETYRESFPRQLYGKDIHYTQAQFAMTRRRGNIRGIHSEAGVNGEPMYKIIRVMTGAIMGFWIDLDPNRDTFLARQSIFLKAVKLTSKDPYDVSMYIPPNIGNSFQVTQGNVLYYYSVGLEYWQLAQTRQIAISPNDPDVGVNWPYKVRGLTERDTTNSLTLKQYLLQVVGYTLK